MNTLLKAVALVMLGAFLLSVQYQLRAALHVAGPNWLRGYFLGIFAPQDDFDSIGRRLRRRAITCFFAAVSCFFGMGLLGGLGILLGWWDGR